MNSWDRQPYLTDIPGGKEAPTYAAKPSNIANNFIIANYGGSQGFDNDDGSSAYHIRDNFIYGEGLKQDYGGHDSVYVDNVNVVHKYDGQNCINTWPFNSGHQHNFSSNRCVVLYTWQYGSTGSCNPQHPAQSRCGSPEHKPGAQCMPDMARNSYYTPFGNATLKCGGGASIAQLQAGGVEAGSTSDKLPTNAQIIGWGREKMGLK
jgi:hypothetical protein